MRRDPDATVALILAGGPGTRLWPLSTEARPKPFRALFDAEPLVAQVARQAATWTGSPASVWISFGEAHLPIAREAIPDLDRHTLILERRAGETTAAIARAALQLAERKPDAVLAVLAADQRMGPDEAVIDALDRAAAVARRGPWLVSLGVPPDRPSPSYGYMRLGAPCGDGAYEGLGYIEKPSAEIAARMLAEGRYLWNVGLFAFRADTLIAALSRHLPEAMAALAEGRDPPRPLRSIDHELMERVRPGDPEGHVFVDARCSFRDCGSLAALAEAAPDAHNNRILGEVVAVDCHDCTLLCEPPRRIRVEGLRGVLVAVGAEGEVLIRGGCASP